MAFSTCYTITVFLGAPWGRRLVHLRVPDLARPRLMESPRVLSIHLRVTQELEKCHLSWEGAKNVDFIPSILSLGCRSEQTQEGSCTEGVGEWV